MRWLLDLLPDLAGIFLAAVSLAVAFLAKELEWFKEHPKTRWVLAAVLALIGIGGVVSNAAQKSEDKSAREKLNTHVAQLRDELDAVNRKLEAKQTSSIGLLTEALAVSGQELKPGLPMPFFVMYGVQSNPAKNARFYQEIFSAKGDFTQEQARRAHAQFLTRAIPSMDIRGQDLAISSTIWKTLQLNLNSTEIRELLDHKRTVYIMGRVEWKNSSGSDDHFDLCSFMESPKMKYFLQSELPFHVCGL